MTLEEYVKKHLKDTNQLLEMLGQPPITAERLRAKGFKVIPCSCGEYVCDGWQLSGGADRRQQENMH